MAIVPFDVLMLPRCREAAASVCIYLNDSIKLLALLKTPNINKIANPSVSTLTLDTAAAKGAFHIRPINCVQMQIPDQAEGDSPTTITAWNTTTTSQLDIWIPLPRERLSG